MTRFKRFVIECKRVLRVTRKPDAKEYKTTVKVTALGVTAIGIIGFIIQLLNQILFG